MKKVLLTGALGILLTVVGFYIGFLYVQNPNGTFFLLISSVILVLIGLFLLYYAEQRNAALQTAVHLSETATALPEKKESMIDRNNRLIEEWNSTSEKRDKLKMVKLASDDKN